MAISMQPLIHKIYADGGVIKTNPSKIGGTWAYILVDNEDCSIRSESGVIHPGDIGMDCVTNNVSELIACLNSLDQAPDGWAGTLYTDNDVTRMRLVNDRPKMLGVPPDLVFRMIDTKKRLGNFKVVLLSGHPTKAQLVAGVGRGGRPVSHWNVQCDRMCADQAVRCAAKLGHVSGWTHGSFLSEAEHGLKE